MVLEINAAIAKYEAVLEKIQDVPNFDNGYEAWGATQQP